MDQCIHADHFGVDIAKWTSTISGVDRGIRLDVILILVGQKLVPALRAYDPGREGVLEFVRSADCANQLADLDLVAIPKFYDR